MDVCSDQNLSGSWSPTHTKMQVADRVFEMINGSRLSRVPLIFDKLNQSMGIGLAYLQ